MDCHLGNLMTSCFPVMCVEKCLVASRLCPGISPCTQVRQGLPGVVTVLWNSLGFVLGRRKMVRRGVCESSLAHLEQSQVQEQDTMSEWAQGVNVLFLCSLHEISPYRTCRLKFAQVPASQTVDTNR